MTNNKTSPIFINKNFSSIVMFFDDEYQIDVNIVYWYALIVNSLIYAMTMIRFDLKFALSVLFRYCFNSNSIYVKIIIRLLHYVKKTLHHNIYYEDKKDLMNYIDADWISVVNDRWSIKKYIYFLFDDFISWSSKRQDRVIQLFCEAEYVTSAEASKKVIWFRLLLIQLHAYFVKASVKLLTDNQEIITFIKNSEYHRRTKHIDVKYHWIKEAVKDEIIEFKYISTEDMIANGLTKPLRAVKFNRFLKMLKMLKEANWSNWMFKRAGNTRVILVFKQVECMQETLKRAT